MASWSQGADSTPDPPPWLFLNLSLPSGSYTIGNGNICIWGRGQCAQVPRKNTGAPVYTGICGKFIITIGSIENTWLIQILLVEIKAEIKAVPKYDIGKGWKKGFFGVVTHFSKFSRHAWEKIPKMLVFTRVYVCVKAKLTFVSFFLEFFFEPFPYGSPLLSVGLSTAK